MNPPSDPSATVVDVVRVRGLVKRFDGVPVLNGIDLDVKLGETLVIMGVSYWEQGKRESGIELTERGVEIIQAAVDKGVVSDEVLVVPYTNLATRTILYFLLSLT